MFAHCLTDFLVSRKLPKVSSKNGDFEVLQEKINMRVTVLTDINQQIVNLKILPEQVKAKGQEDDHQDDGTDNDDGNAVKSVLKVSLRITYQSIVARVHF